jgi:hypothetical protein
MFFYKNERFSEFLSQKQEAGIAKKYVKTVCENPCKIIESISTGTGLIIFHYHSFVGAQLISYGNTYCSKYNKAEAMEMFLVGKKQARGRKNVIFVDDNSDNTWNIFEFFAAKEISGMCFSSFDIFTCFIDELGSSTMKVTSCWFTPPFKSENIEPTLLNRLKILHEKHAVTLTY